MPRRGGVGHSRWASSPRSSHGHSHQAVPPVIQTSFLVREVDLRSRVSSARAGHRGVDAGSCNGCEIEISA